ncbi:hypothetical protein BMS3Abin11_00098 [bacterium BMS3Abin11]|nr:hypothetical protein BMS3Abin11_00098 [bacterium BMS3Abin11]
MIYGLTKHRHDIVIPPTIPADNQAITRSGSKKTLLNLTIIAKQIDFQILNTFIPEIPMNLRVYRKALCIKCSQRSI